MAGPSRMARFRLLALIRIALGRSVPPTMSCRMSWLAVAEKTPAAPCTSRMATACHRRSVSVRKSSPQAAEASMNMPCEIWISLRQS
jgi:hypothetical protein